MNWLRRKLAEWFHRPLIHVGYGDIVLYDGVREDDNSHYVEIRNDEAGILETFCGRRWNLNDIRLTQLSRVEEMTCGSCARTVMARHLDKNLK